MILVAQMAFGLLAMTICLPSMQEWGGLFGVPQATVQLTFSGYLLAYGLLQLVYGPLSDRLGRRQPLLVGLALATAGMAMAALAPTVEVLIAARVLQGAGCAACMVLGRAALQDLFEGPERTRMMAFVGMAMGVCPPTATVIGGQMHVHLGWASNFVLLALIGAGLWLAAWRALPDDRPAPGTPSAHPGRGGVGALLGGYRRLAREPAFLLNVWVLATTAAAFYSYLGGAPIVLRHYGIGPGSVGLFIMLTPLSYIVGNYLTTRLVRRRGEAWIRNLGHGVATAGIVAMMLLAAVGVAHPLAFSIPLMLLGIGNGLLLPPTLSATVGSVPALAGAASAVAGVSQQLTGALGGYAVGWISLATPLPLGALMLLFTLLSIGGQLMLNRRTAELRG